MHLRIALLASALGACATPAPTDAEFRADVVAQMHAQVATEVAALQQAARDLQSAAPTDHAWDRTTDAAALAAMTSAWRRARVAYEHVEGVVAPIFPELDVSMDARYDDFLVGLGTAGDPTPFDGTGVTGMHAIERILYADAIPAQVVAFESTLPGYRPAAMPATAADAASFRTGLCQRLIDDADALAAQWQPAAIDIGVAYQGLVALMNEQTEKVNKAATGEEESRYSQLTLFDLRNNLVGARATYALFEPWIAARTTTGAEDPAITAGLADLAADYTAITGDAVPPVPSDWSSDAPTAADLATPFGQLWRSVHVAVDPTAPGSVVYEMNAVATLLGFPEFAVH